MTTADTVTWAGGLARPVVPDRARATILAAVVLLHLALFVLIQFGFGVQAGAAGRSLHDARTMGVMSLAPHVNAGQEGVGDAASGASHVTQPSGSIAALPPARDIGMGTGGRGRDHALDEAIAGALADDPLSGMGWAGYDAILRRHIARYRQRPDASGRQAGTVIVRFNLDRSGHIVDARVLKTQGPSLDEAALAALWRAEPLPGVPGQLPVPYEVDVPIDFVRG